MSRYEIVEKIKLVVYTFALNLRGDIVNGLNILVRPKSELRRAWLANNS